ncbi:uncharacterized protein METZ01_LOCUS20821 [marine metagenome]|uniref:Uncharacterized protein n=1 Tax=marine metagenome TaxID=408172 RepID=A0A381PPE0_9ZZZZ
MHEIFLANAVTTCNNSVDFPAPGSPPIKTTEPGTRPPPRTRSSSLSPVWTRALSSSRMSASFLTAVATPPNPVAILSIAGVCFDKVIGFSVFQLAHAEHWPCHLL